MLPLAIGIFCAAVSHRPFLRCLARTVAGRAGDGGRAPDRPVAAIARSFALTRGHGSYVDRRGDHRDARRLYLPDRRSSMLDTGWRSTRPIRSRARSSISPPARSPRLARSPTHWSRSRHGGGSRRVRTTQSAASLRPASSRRDRDVERAEARRAAGSYRRKSARSWTVSGTPALSLPNSSTSSAGEPRIPQRTARWSSADQAPARCASNAAQSAWRVTSAAAHSPCRRAKARSLHGKPIGSIRSTPTPRHAACAGSCRRCRRYRVGRALFSRKTRWQSAASLSIRRAAFVGTERFRRARHPSRSPSVRPRNIRHARALAEWRPTPLANSRRVRP